MPVTVSFSASSGLIGGEGGEREVEVRVGDCVEVTLEDAVRVEYGVSAG